MLKFNTFRAQRYLRSRFIEGTFLLASEATDMELELIDFTRALIRHQVGDVAVGDAWKVERIDQLNFRVKPGEAWFDGLPYFMRSSSDQLVSGNTLALGISPVGTTIVDDPNGTGKIITLDGSTPDDTYRVVIQAKEEPITNIVDPFIKNANLSESTAQKMRLNYTIHIVPDTDQVTSPVPYTGDNSTDKNLVNEIKIQVGAAASPGSLVIINQVTGSEQIDGRNIEMIVVNSTGSNPIPKTIADQSAFSGGKLIDNFGNEYHIISIFNNPSDASNQEVIRIDKEPDQPDPTIALNASYTIVKRDVFTTDDTNGTPTGKRYYPVAKVAWKQTDGMVHDSVVEDLRQVIEGAGNSQDTAHTKFDIRLAAGGTVTAEPTEKASGTFTITDYTQLTGDTFEIRGVSFVEGVDFDAVTDNDTTAANLAQAINDSGNVLIDGVVEANASTNVVTITAIAGGTAANSYTISFSDDPNGATSSAATMAGGVDATSGQLVWSDDFEIVNPHGVAKSLVAASDAVLQDGGSLAYFLDYAIGSDTNVEFGELAVTTTSNGTSISLSGAPNLSQIKVGNTILILGTKESAAITAIDDVNDVVTVDAALTGTGAATIYLDTFAAGTLPLGPSTFVLAVKTGNIIQITNGVGLESGESTSGAGGVPQQLLDYIGSTGETDSNPNYSSTNVVGQGDDLTTAISDLDSRSGSLTDIIRQNNNNKLVKGGTWSWAVATNTLTWTSTANVMIGGLANTVNSIAAAANTDLDADGKVLYVQVNRTGPGGPLTVLSADIASVVMTDNTYIFARRVGADVLIGDSFQLKDDEYLELDGALSEINRYLDQLKLDTNANPNEITIDPADSALLDSTILTQELNNFVLSFAGATLDFTAGTGTVTTVGLDAIGTSIPTVGEYKWFGIGLLPDSVSADNRITAQIQVTPASASNAVAGSAPFPNILGDKKLGAVLIQNVAGAAVVTSVRRLGVGSGSGGSGTGDANSLIETLKNQLDDSLYAAVTPNIFTQDEDNKIDGSSTGEFSLVTKTFEMDSAETMVSAQMLDATFLAAPSLLDTVDLAVFWELATLDLAATYEVSRDGGNEYQAVSMTRNDSTETYNGRHTFAEEAATQSVDSEATTSDGSSELNTSTTQQQSQNFAIANATVIKEVDIDITVTGSPLGYLFVSIVADDTALPSTDPNDVLAESVAVDVSTLSTGTMTVNMPDTALAPGTYHIVVRTDDVYKASFVTSTTVVSVDTVASGSGYEAFDGATWTAPGGGMLHDFKGSIMDLRVRVTASGSGGNLQGYGVFYELQSTGVIGGIKNREVEHFDSLTNPNEFTLGFLPDSDLLSVYLVQTGQVFKTPAFVLDGHKVIFPADSFDNGGISAPMTLVFDQTSGTSFDNSDENASLLAANFLGSTDPAIDKSAVGRGIFLRRPDGTLRELRITDSDTIDILDITQSIVNTIS